MKYLKIVSLLVVALVSSACTTDGSSGFGLLTGWLAQSDEDYATAAEKFRESAERGDADGQNSLGELYEQGNGVAQDYAKAAAWYRRAAEQGHPGGQFNLGRMYRDGRGVPQDDVLAYVWMNLAATGDALGAMRRERDAARARLSPAQLAEAQVLSRKIFERQQ